VSNGQLLLRWRIIFKGLARDGVPYGQIFLKNHHASFFNEDLSNEPNFGRTISLDLCGFSMQEELEGEPSTPEELAAATFAPHLNNFHTSGVGTQAYASPEQLHTSKVKVVSCHALFYYLRSSISQYSRETTIGFLQCCGSGSGVGSGSGRIRNFLQDPDPDAE
jgi:hypothetical protein